MAGSAWPRRAATTCTGTPALSSRVACTWRRSCSRIGGRTGLVVPGVDRLDGAAHEGASHVGEEWVREYPATLIPQAEAIWSHPLTEVQVRNDGTAWCVLPLRTMDEAPSDLSAELEIDEQGRVTISDVHVL